MRVPSESEGAEKAGVVSLDDAPEDLSRQPPAATLPLRDDVDAALARAIDVPPPQAAGMSWRSWRASWRPAGSHQAASCRFSNDGGERDEAADVDGAIATGLEAKGQAGRTLGCERRTCWRTQRDRRREVQPDGGDAACRAALLRLAADVRREPVQPRQQVLHRLDVAPCNRANDLSRALDDAAHVRIGT
jgi:hypothetical protein